MSLNGRGPVGRITLGAILGLLSALLGALLKPCWCHIGATFAALESSVTPQEGPSGPFERNLILVAPLYIRLLFSPNEPPHSTARGNVTVIPSHGEGDVKGIPSHGRGL